MDAAPAGAPARSCFFVPGGRPERFDKAWASDADEIIIDLEDAVAPNSKVQARHCVADWLDRRRRVWLRVNAVDSAWFDDDRRWCMDAGGGKQDRVPPICPTSPACMPHKKTAPD